MPKIQPIETVLLAFMKTTDKDLLKVPKSDENKLGIDVEHACYCIILIEVWLEQIVDVLASSAQGS